MIKEFTIYDDDGTLIRSSQSRGSQNESEWVIMYRKAIEQIVDEAPDLTTLRVFLKLSALQDYGDKPIYMTKTLIADKLGVSRQMVHRSFNWLIDRSYIKVVREYGMTQIYLNPDVTTCGKDRTKKVRKWSLMP